MTGSYQYSPGIWPALLVLALLILLALYARQRLHLVGARQFAIASVFASLWVAGSVMELAAVDLATKVVWYKVQVAWQIPTVTAIACFVFEYAWPSRWLTRRNLALLSVAPIAMVLLILTNDLHNLMWVSLAAGGQISPVRGPANWLLVSYTIVLGSGQVVALVWLFVRSRLHRWPAGLMLLTVLGNRIAYLVVAADPARNHLPPEILMVGLATLTFAVALFGFRILDPVAQAQWTAIEQMSDGMVVLDTAGRIASFNPAAQAILAVPAKVNAVGQPIQNLLPVAAAMSAGHAEVSLVTGPMVRQVLVAASELKDFRGLTSGRLLLLRDVTDERRAQAAILEQQRSLATLTERERLARELHDSLGQTLAAAHLQVRAAKLFLEQQRWNEADECLGRLADMTLAAEIDVREYILGARTFFGAAVPFLKALREYMARFGQRYAIQAELSVPEAIEERSIDPAVETQLLRIVQEALSNVRKHARAKACRVTFALAEPLLEVTITDDGCGFDLAAAANHGEGYGLRSMRERAEAVGGSLQVTSQPGRGTTIKVSMPVEELGKDGRIA